MKPIVEYEFEGHKLPMELMVWDRDDQPELRLVYAIIPSHEFKYQVMDSEWTNEYKHAALPEGIEPKKKEVDLMGKVLVDKSGNRSMITAIHKEIGALDLFETCNTCLTAAELHQFGYQFEDGTPLGGES
jgi:hypothetical protein